MSSSARLGHKDPGDSMVSGWLRLTVFGIVVVTLLQGIGIILVAGHLLSGGLPWP
jgi:hypothetical protein